MAVPVPASAYRTVAWRPEAALRVAVYVSGVEPLSPSVTLGSLIDSVGVASSSVIVPVPVPAVVETAAFTGSFSRTFTVSFASSKTSPVTDTLKVWLVVPAAKVSVPPAMAVWSVPEVAVPVPASV